MHFFGTNIEPTPTKMVNHKQNTKQVTEFTYTIYHVNIQNLGNKLDEIAVVVKETRPSIICFTETWTPENGMDSMVIPGYKLASYFCRAHHKHGGVAIYTRDDIPIKSVQKAVQFNAEMHLECTAIQTTIDNKKTAIISLYRPPTGDINIFLYNLSSLLTHVSSICPQIILCGDLNIDSLKPEHLNYKLLSDVMSSFNITNHCSDPTRVFQTKKSLSVTSIDYVISNIEHIPLKCDVVNHNLSDHLSQLLTLNIKPMPPSTNKNANNRMRNLSQANLNILKLNLQEETWDAINNSDINAAFEAFLQIFMWHFDQTCPMKELKTNNNKYTAWINDDIKKENRELKDLFTLMKVYNSEELKIEYKNKKKRYKQTIKNTKRNFFGSQIQNSSNKCKEIWKIINHELGRTKKETNIQLNIDETVIEDPKQVANAFGNYFSTITQKKAEEHFGNNISTSCTTSSMVQHSIFFEPVDKSEVIAVIKNLKNKNSCGVDGVSTKVVKSVCEEIALPLSALINKSIETGEFPSAMKLASVVPIHKKGDTTNMENYRPVSILSVFSKIFERIIYNRLIKFLDRFNLFSNNQHGFRSKRSTESASFNFVEFIHKQLDNNRYVVGLFFDLSRAFDTLDVNFIRGKLYNLGVRGNILNWVISFLSERQLLVKINHTLSDSYKIDIGCAQGSVIAPLIFLLYINDLLLSEFTIQFADDTSVIIAADTENELTLLINRVMREMENWCHSNKLILNAQKTVSVHFYKTRPIVDIEGSVITAKFLGSFLDSQLRWNEQINHVSKKLNSAYYALLRLKQNTDHKAMLSSYYALAYSHMSYNIILWGKSTEINRVFVAQKRIIRLMFNLNNRDSCRPIFKKENILTLLSIYILKCAVYVYNNLHVFVKNGEIHSYPTRATGKISIPKHNTALYKKSPYYSCAKIYNSLPQCVTKAKSVKEFNRVLKSYLYKQSFYTLDEFYSDSNNL